MSSQGPGQVLFAFVRHWSRRAETADGDIADQGRLVLVSEAVNSLQARGESATVNAVAQEIGIDQSGASRLMKSAATAGYLSVQAASADGRRREASLTPAGQRMIDQAHEWQEQVFKQMTAAWNEERRREFHRSMADLMRASRDLDGA